MRRRRANGGRGEHDIESLAVQRGLAVLGREVGSQWEAWRKHLEYVDYAAAVLLVVLVVFLIVRWRQGRGDREARQADPATDVVAD